MQNNRLRSLLNNDTKTIQNNLTEGAVWHFHLSCVENFHKNYSCAKSYNDHFFTGGTNKVMKMEPKNKLPLYTKRRTVCGKELL